MLGSSRLICAPTIKMEDPELEGRKKYEISKKRSSVVTWQGKFLLEFVVPHPPKRQTFCRSSMHEWTMNVWHLYTIQLACNSLGDHASFISRKPPNPCGRTKRARLSKEVFQRGWLLRPHTELSWGSLVNYLLDFFLIPLLLADVGSVVRKKDGEDGGEEGLMLSLAQQKRSRTFLT